MASQIKSVNGGTGVRMADGMDLDMLEIGCTLMDIEAYMTSLGCAKQLNGYSAGYDDGYNKSKG